MSVKERLRAAGVQLGGGGGLNGQCYAWMITNEVLPLVRAMFDGPYKEVWQDDAAVIHR